MLFHWRHHSGGIIIILVKRDFNRGFIPAESNHTENDCEIPIERRIINSIVDREVYHFLSMKFYVEVHCTM